MNKICCVEWSLHEEEEEERYFRQREYNKKMMNKQRLHRLLRQRPKDESSESKGPGKVW